MKKYTLGIVLLITTAFSACTQSAEELFDTSASERIEKSAQDFKELLKKPEKGWVMEYYPNSQLTYGGYEFTMKFIDNENVTISGELFGDAQAFSTSKYAVQKDMSVTLNFNTYNPIFNYLSDPDPHNPGIYSPYGYMENGLIPGMGYEGDYEFVLVSANEQEIILQGKKTLNKIRMIPLNEDSENYLNKVIGVSEKVFNVPAVLGFEGNINGKDVELLYDINRGRRFEIVYDNTYMGAISLMPTSDGLKAYEPINIDGISVQNFKFADNKLTCTDKGAESVSLSYKANDEYLTYQDYIGNYTLAFDSRKVTTAQVTVLEEGKTMLLSGLNSNYQVVMTYDSIMGTASILSQKVFTEYGRDIWICGYDSSAGRFSWNTRIGMETQWNKDPENFVLTFKDNGFWGSYTATGFYYYSFDEGTTSNGAFYEGFSDNFACETLKTLTKK